MKKRDSQQMTQSLEDYLESIYILIKEGHDACVRDVAKHLDVKMPSVVKARSEEPRQEIDERQERLPAL